MFPFEIVTNILRFCDGKTLKVAINVDPLWKNVVAHLTKDTDIWEECCHKDIPEHELEQIKNKFSTLATGRSKWLSLYENWLNWASMNKENVSFGKVEEVGKINRVSAICSLHLDDFLVVGFESGAVKIIDKHMNTARTIRDVNLPIQAIYILRDEKRSENDLLVHAANRVFIYDILDGEYDCDTFDNCYLFSHYGNYLCGVSKCGYVKVALLVTDKDLKKKELKHIYHGRIYSDNVLYSCSFLKDQCMVLVNNILHTIDCTEAYNSITPSQQKNVLDFCSKVDYMSKVYIFNNEVVISLTRPANLRQQQILEIFILNKEFANKKLFMPWSSFKAFVTCIHLYCSTLVIGLSNGFVYFYKVKNWMLFDIRDFVYKTTVSKYVPILKIDLAESPRERIFFISTNCTIYKLKGSIGQNSGSLIK